MQIGDIARHSTDRACICVYILISSFAGFVIGINVLPMLLPAFAAVSGILTSVSSSQKILVSISSTVVSAMQRHTRFPSLCGLGVRLKYATPSSLFLRRFPSKIFLVYCCISFKSVAQRGFLVFAVQICNITPIVDCIFERKPRGPSFECAGGICVVTSQITMLCLCRMLTLLTWYMPHHKVLITHVNLKNHLPWLLILTLLQELYF